MAAAVRLLDNVGTGFGAAFALAIGLVQLFIVWVTV